VCILLFRSRATCYIAEARDALTRRVGVSRASSLKRRCRPYERYRNTCWNTRIIGFRLHARDFFLQAWQAQGQAAKWRGRSRRRTERRCHDCASRAVCSTGQCDICSMRCCHLGIFSGPPPPPGLTQPLCSSGTMRVHSIARRPAIYHFCTLRCVSTARSNLSCALARAVLTRLPLDMLHAYTVSKQYQQLAQCARSSTPASSAETRLYRPHMPPVILFPWGT
jgi:hypothetical protein